MFDFSYIELKNRETKLLKRRMTTNMQTNSFSSKISGMVSKIIEKLMIGLGLVTLVWLLAFLLVSLIDK